MFEIRVEQLRTRITEIQNYRISQIEDGRKYLSQVNKLTSALNRLLKRGARNLLTPQEQALLDKQDHVTFSEMAPVEKQRIQTEVDIMWGQIPEHLQEKAQRMAGLR